MAEMLSNHTRSYQEVPRQREIAPELLCDGQHRFFVANDAATDEGKVLIFLVCTACGESKKVEFEVGKMASVTLKK